MAATAGPAVTDWMGDEHTVEGLIYEDGRQFVFFDDYGFTPDDAREIARQLVACADALDGFLPFDGNSTWAEIEEALAAAKERLALDDQAGTPAAYQAALAQLAERGVQTWPAA